MNLTRIAAVQWLSVAAAVALVYLISQILTPFVAAGILAYICNPLVQALCARKMPRTLAVALVMSGILLLVILLLIPVAMFYLLRDWDTLVALRHGRAWYLSSSMYRQP